MTREKEINMLAQRIVNSEKITTMQGAVEYVLQWADAHPKNPWISVEDRLPEELEMVFVHMKGGSCDSAIYTNGAFDRSLQIKFGMKDGGHTIISWEQKFKSTITHWMPIPKLFHDDMLINGLNEMNEHFKKGEYDYV